MARAAAFESISGSLRFAPPGLSRERPPSGFAYSGRRSRRFRHRIANEGRRATPEKFHSAGILPGLFRRSGSHHRRCFESVANRRPSIVIRSPHAKWSELRLPVVPSDRLRQSDALRVLVQEAEELELAAELAGWFQGRKLAYTLAVLAVGGALGCFAIGELEARSAEEK